MFAASLLATLLVATHVSPSAQIPVASVEGSVLRATTGEPLAQSQVTLIPTGNAKSNTGEQATTQEVSGTRPGVFAMTDAEGRFSFRNVASGTYRLLAVRNGYASQEYGQQRAGRPGKELRVSGNESIKSIDFRLVPAGTITGRVISTFGEPLAKVRVELLRPTYDENGKRQFRAVASDQTDDKGEYRLFWIPAGRYFLKATPTPSIGEQLNLRMNGIVGIGFDAVAGVAEAFSSAQTLALDMFPSDQAIVNPGYVPTYYPATVDASAAGSVELRSGDELGSIDIRVDVRPSIVPARVRGRVLDITTGRPPRNVSVMLVGRNGEGIQRNATYNSATGEFEIPGVEPGSYMLTAMGNMIAVFAAMAATEDGKPPANLPIPDVAQMPLEVTGDMDGIVLKIAPPISIPGQVMTSGLKTPEGGADPMHIQVFLTPDVGDESYAGGSFVPAPVGPDGRFVVRASPGRYRILVVGLPQSRYLKAARLGAADVLDGPLNVTDTTSETLYLELSADSGEIDGLTLDKDRAARLAQVVLIPEKRARRDLYRTAMSGEDGRFKMEGITPGNYRLFAWDDLEPNAYYDSEVLMRYELQGLSVVVRESTKAQIEIQLIRVQ